MPTYGSNPACSDVVKVEKVAPKIDFLKQIWSPEITKDFKNINIIFVVQSDFMFKITV